MQCSTVIQSVVEMKFGHEFPPVSEMQMYSHFQYSLNIFLSSCADIWPHL